MSGIKKEKQHRTAARAFSVISVETAKMAKKRALHDNIT